MKKDSIISYIEKNLSEKRRIHTYAVRDTAIKLAAHYDEDIEKTELAALCHDMYRGMRDKVLNMYVRELGLPERYMDNPNLAHGKIAAIMIQREYNITDEDIINAVSFHTTGRADMSLLEKIIYLADTIEPNREYPGVDEVRKLAFEDLDKALLKSMQNTIDYIEQRGFYLDRETIEARDFLLGKDI